MNCYEEAAHRVITACKLDMNTFIDGSMLIRSLRLLDGKEMPLALTVSMYSDLLDLRATGAGLVDMVVARHCLLSQLAFSHTLHVNSLFFSKRCRHRNLALALSHKRSGVVAFAA